MLTRNLSIEDQVRIAIAKLCGWHCIEVGGRLDGPIVGYPRNGYLVGMKQEIPLVTLDAMWELEDNMMGDDPAAYERLLLDVWWRRYHENLGRQGAAKVYWTQALWHMTAMDRAEAMLRLRGRWTA